MVITLEQKEILKNQYCNELNTIPYENIKAYMTQKVWWECKTHHIWQATIKSRFQQNTQCPICMNRQVLPGYNDLATTHPTLAAQWHPTRNGNHHPTDFVSGSKTKAWWVCDKGHEWETSIKNRATQKQNCPYCANKKILPGYNDLATTHPHLIKIWNFSKNNKTINPTQVTAGSNKTVQWVCEKGHEWEAKIYNVSTGTKCPYCRGTKTLPGFNDLQTINPALAAQWHPTKNKTLHIENYTQSSDKKVWWVCDKGHEWETKISHRSYGYGCPICGKTISSSENELYVYLTQLIPNKIIRNDRKTLNGHELDILIPSRGVAIEFNGLYWHSEANGKGKTYHYDKWKACQEQGIQLIQVWEDDWNRNPELVKRMLAHKLGVSSEPRVYARNTVVRELPQEESNAFLNKYHIQGSVNGGVRLGLILGGDIEKLVAVMVLKTEPGTNGKTLNLLRYATSQPVPGGFSKILTQVERTYTPESIITFSDNTVSDGGLYKNNGFIPVKELKPDYSYVRNGVREHKFGYRLKRFRNDPALQYVVGLTEKELAQLNGLPRVWDAGKTKWVKLLVSS